MPENKFEREYNSRKNFEKVHEGGFDFDNYEKKEKENIGHVENQLSEMFKDKEQEVLEKDIIQEKEEDDVAVQKLIELAFLESPEKAIQKAQKLFKKNPYELDKFHDLLVKKLKSKNIKL